MAATSTITNSPATVDYCNTSTIMMEVAGQPSSSSLSVEASGSNGDNYNGGNTVHDSNVVNNNASRNSNKSFLPSSEVNSSQTKTHHAATQVVSKADRMKDLQLMESYLLNAPPPLLLQNSTTATTRATSEGTTDSNCGHGFSTTEILHEQLFQQHNTTSDDERLLNQIISGTTSSNSYGTTFVLDRPFERQSSITSSMNLFLPSRPRLQSLVSRQSSINDAASMFDSTIFNSTAWKPMFQSDHQEIPYSPERIFVENGNDGAAFVAAGSLLQTTTTSNETARPDISASATSVHTAGAETLLLAAQVISSNRNGHADSVTTTASNGDNEEQGTKGRKKRGRIIKNDDIVPSRRNGIQHNSEDDVNTNGDIPIGHVIVENGRIAELVADANITIHDVLLGRGGRTNHHTGNAIYRQCVEELQEEYLHATKDQKTLISNRLVQRIHSEKGRFLKAYKPKNEVVEDGKKFSKKSKKHASTDTGVIEHWYEVDLLTARKKASQALREINTPENRAAKRAKYSQR